MAVVVGVFLTLSLVTEYILLSKTPTDKTDPIFRSSYKSQVCIIRLLDPPHCSDWLVKGHMTRAEPMGVIPGTLAGVVAGGPCFLFTGIPQL